MGAHGVNLSGGGGVIRRQYALSTPTSEKRGTRHGRCDCSDEQHAFPRSKKDGLGYVFCPVDFDDPALDHLSVQLRPPSRLGRGELCRP